MIYFSLCAGCNEPGHVICPRCQGALESAPVASPSALPRVYAAMSFEGVARDVVLALKYGRRRAVARRLAVLLVARLPPAELERVGVVTWAPTSGARARERGFDQAELLARAVARRLRLPCRRLLYRGHGPHQTGRSREERLQGPVFRARPLGRGEGVLLVDDVVTTGSTLGSAVQALREAGVGSVVCMAAAATPVARRAQPPMPAQRRTVATASAGSTSTTTARIPTEIAASTFDVTSSRNTVRSA
ncbi:MAG: hypothetical protein RLZ04_778 [Actinomycetota bacterium]|jgi:predicted amidophosphoribosyltransferase